MPGWWSGLREQVTPITGQHEGLPSNRRREIAKSASGKGSTAPRPRLSEMIANSRRGVISKSDREHKHHYTKNDWCQPGSCTEAVLGLQTSGPVAHGHRAERAQQYIREARRQGQIAFRSRSDPVARKSSRGQACGHDDRVG